MTTPNYILCEAANPGSRRPPAPLPIVVEEQLIETWAIHNRINLYLLDAIPDDALGSSLPTKSRTVHDLFAHMHNVRLLWLKSAESGPPGGPDQARNQDAR